MPVIRAGLVAVLLAASCEYDARVGVNAPDWAAEAETALVALDMSPRSCGTDPAAPVVVSFALVNDRGAPIATGDVVELPEGNVTAGADTVTAALEGASFTEVSTGAQTPLTDGSLAAVAWVSGQPDGVLALTIEASAAATALDPTDERLRAAELAAREYLGHESRRLTVYALAGGAADPRLPPGSDVAAAAVAIAGIAGIQGGDAPVLDGVVTTTAVVRGATAEGAALLLVGSAFTDRGSLNGVEDAINVLTTPSPVPLFVAAIDDSPDLRLLACMSGGAFLAVGDAARLVPAAVTLAAATAGHWTAELSRPAGLAVGSYRLTGDLRVSIAGEQRVIPIDFLIDLP